jgi:hypothetical protein
MWLRVFASTDTMPQPADVQQRLRELGRDVALDVKGDDLGWTSIDAGGLRVERYLTEEDDLRDELDAWAAVAESWDGESLMGQIIATRQLFTLHGPNDSAAILEGLARVLAGATGSFYHADGRGFCAADGSLLLSEPPA